MKQIASFKFSVLFLSLLSVTAVICLGGVSRAGNGRTGLPPPEFQCPDLSAETDHPPESDDESLLEMIQKHAFAYFWCEANPANGLIRDRDTFRFSREYHRDQLWFVGLYCRDRPRLDQPKSGKRTGMADIEVFRGQSRGTGAGRDRLSRVLLPFS